MTNSSLPSTPVASLAVGEWFTLDGYDYRVLRHWSTGVEIKGASSYDDKRVISGATLVQR